MAVELAKGYKVRLLQAKVPLLNALRIGLFRNEPTLSADTTLDDLARYVCGAGPLLVDPGPWGPAFSGVDGMGQVQSKILTFKCTTSPPLRARGWYAIDELGFYAFGDYIDSLAPVIIGGPLLAFVMRIVLFEETLRGL